MHAIKDGQRNSLTGGTKAVPQVVRQADGVDLTSAPYPALGSTM
jgi:hypothetical protein